jgi:protein involved in polysaccharide export with SLBB domain
MRRECVTALCLTTLAVIAVVFGVNPGVARPQDAGKDPRPQPGPDAKKKTDVPVPPLPIASDPQDRSRREEAIGKKLAAYDLRPRPLAPIPDDPPPHEGAMIGLPYVVEPPDLVLIEVLEAMPGRPISGERLVRPDGTISLGFYGDVHVKGLTLDQMKVAIIKHLRTYIADVSLGLEASSEPSEVEEPAPNIDRPPLPAVPKDGKPVFDGLDEPKKRSSSLDRGAKTRPAAHRSAARGAGTGTIPVRQTAGRGLRHPAQDQGVLPQAPTQITLPVGGTSGVTITIQVDGQNRAGAGQGVIAVPLPQPVAEARETWTLVAPEKSQTVFVDVTSYNSKQYYVEGDFATNGRMPWTGNETVLDAIHFAGGFLSSAEPKDIRLVRPPRGGKPAKVFKVDYEAIQAKGEVASNYQIFPGDRLIVGRNEVVKKTTDIDRLNAPILSITGTILQEAMALRTLQFATASNRDELLKEYVDFWSKAVFQDKDLRFDEQTLREAFVRKMKLKPGPIPGVP